MKTPLLCLAALPFLFTACETTPSGPTPPLPTGYVAYDPPKGNPTLAHEWNNFGPGTILVTSSQSQYSRAHHLIGEAAVAQLADLSKASPLQMKRGSSEEKALREAAISFAKGSLTSAGVSASTFSETSSEYSWGQTHLTQIPLIELFSKVRDRAGIIAADPTAGRALRNDQYRIVQAVIFTDALTVKVKDASGRKLNLEAALTEQQKATLRSERATVREDEISFTAPRFAAYCPLHRTELINRNLLPN